MGLGLVIIGFLVYKEFGLVNDDIFLVLNVIIGGDFIFLDFIRIIVVVIIVIGVFLFLVFGVGIVGICGKFWLVFVVVRF